MKTYQCRRAPEPIGIDGNTSDPAWNLAEPVELVRNLDGGIPRFATTARLLWDDTCLYISFVCLDEEIFARMAQRDDPLWEEEVVEVFINPNGDVTGYLEYEVNPLNTLLDLYVLNRPPHPAHFLFAWNSRGIRHAVRVKGDAQRKDSIDQSWNVEIAIPWEDFVTAPHLPPLSGDRWRINLYRIDRYQGQEELSAWSPTGQPTFHVPGQFGELIFL
jgi:hypothetical protein